MVFNIIEFPKNLLSECERNIIAAAGFSIEFPVARTQLLAELLVGGAEIKIVFNEWC